MSLKKLLRHPLAQHLFASVIVLYYRLVYATSTVELHGADNLLARWQQGDQALVAAFHGRLMFLVNLRPKNTPVHALISEHADGQVITKVAKMLGVGAANGSTTRGGAKAVRQLLNYAKQGDSLFITPDGPKGPRMSVSKGTIEVAKLTGLPIYPMAGSCTKGWLIKSWDRFLLPKPFGTLRVYVGKPVVIKRDSSEGRRAEQRQDLQHIMIELQNKADRACGRGTVPKA